MIYNKLKLLHLASSKTSWRKPVTQNLQYQHLPNHTQTPLTMLSLLPLWKHQQLNFPNSILTWPTPNFGRLIQTGMFSVQSLTSLAVRFMLSYTVFLMMMSGVPLVIPSLIFLLSQKTNYWPYHTWAISHKKSSPPPQVHRSWFWDCLPKLPKQLIKHPPKKSIHL